MAITNFSGDVNQKTAVEDVFCSAELSGGTQNQLICLSVLNILMAIIAFVGNTLILIALYKESPLHSPSKLLFRNLATTDLFVGILAEPLAVISWMFLARKQWNMCRYTIVALVVTGYTLCAASLLTSTAISVDRLLALLLGLRYRQVVTVKRAHVSIIVFWVVSILNLPMFFWINPVSVRYLRFTGVALCLVTLSYCYTKIFLTLRHRQRRVQTNNAQRDGSQTIPLNIARYRKTVSSALWVQFTLFICYLLYGVLAFFTMQNIPNSAMYLAWQVTITLVCLNSLLKAHIHPRCIARRGTVFIYENPPILFERESSEKAISDHE